MKTSWPNVVRFESLPSTNTEAARQAMQGAEEGLCIVAGEQTAGRGRLQRQWISPAGAGLYCSVLLRPRLDVTLWTLIPLLAAVAVHDALVDACALETDIKWPNDILAGGKKLCGILAETIETGTGRALIVGIGINLTSASFPPDLRDVATSVEQTTGTPPELERLLQSLLHEVRTRYEAFQTTDGPAQLRAAWTRRSSYDDGKRVRITAVNEVFEGTTRGLEGDGALRVETDSGVIRIVRAGDVSLRNSEP
jgi:BirA family transcriptional regulator, biotin operon repressor / biotin---[acetyl-CoA-carboxylase] ligase